MRMLPETDEQIQSDRFSYNKECISSWRRNEAFFIDQQWNGLTDEHINENSTFYRTLLHELSILELASDLEFNELSLLGESGKIWL